MGIQVPTVIATVTEDEADFCKCVAWHAQQSRIPFGRAVELFGHIVQGMLAFDIESGHDANTRANHYISGFLDGLGASNHNLEVDVEVIDNEARH
jgi:hypothetical protein